MSTFTVIHGEDKPYVLRALPQFVTGRVGAERVMFTSCSTVRETEDAIRTVTPGGLGVLVLDGGLMHRGDAIPLIGYARNHGHFGPIIANPGEDDVGEMMMAAGATHLCVKPANPAGIIVKMVVGKEVLIAGFDALQSTKFCQQMAATFPNVGVWWRYATTANETIAKARQDLPAAVVANMAVPGMLAAAMEVTADGVVPIRLAIGGRVLGFDSCTADEVPAKLAELLVQPLVP